MFCSCRISTDKHVAQFLCHSRASCSKWRMPPSLIFKFVKCHWQTVSGRHRLIIVLTVVKIGRLVVEILPFFEILKWLSPPFWIFWNREILLAIEAERVETHQRAKFRQNRLIGCEDIKIFTARRLAKRGICRRRVSLSVCLSVCVCVSVTLRYCIKTAKRRITQITPHDSPVTLVLWHQSSPRNSNGITPYAGDKCRWGGLKFVTFDEKRAITRKRYKIDV